MNRLSILLYYIQDQISWYMLFAYDIVIVDESKESVNLKLNIWGNTLETKEFKYGQDKISKL